MAIGTKLTIITLNVNGLNPPIKGHRVADWITTTTTIYMLPMRDSLQNQRHTQMESEESEGMEKDISHKWK